jgi:hypothetical protein
MPTYKLGRDCVATIPGVQNADIQDVDINVQGNEIDVTVFKDSPLEQVEMTIGLADVSFDVTCTAHNATIGQEGTMTLAHLDSQLNAVVTDIKESVTPKGFVQYTVSYGVFYPST